MVKEEVTRKNELEKEESTGEGAERQSEAQPEREGSMSIRESKRESFRGKTSTRGTKTSLYFRVSASLKCTS